MTRLEKLRAVVSAAEREIAAIERRQGAAHLPAGEAESTVVAAAQRYGVTVADILAPYARGRRVPRALAHAREDAAYDLRLLNLSYPQIGRLLHRDHSTVLAAVRRAQARRDPIAEAV